MHKHGANVDQILGNPRFQALVRKRNRFAFSMAGLIVLAYFAYILFIAFAPAVMARPVLPGWLMSLGVPLGLAVIALTVLLTVLYVRRANREFDVETLAIRREALR